MRFERVCGFCGDFWNGGLGATAHGLDHKFCGRACLSAWEMNVSFAQVEIEAIEKMLPAMGEYVAGNGLIDKSFGQCSRDEILGLFATTVKTFRASLNEALGDDIPF